MVGRRRAGGRCGAARADSSRVLLEHAATISRLLTDTDQGSACRGPKTLGYAASAVVAKYAPPPSGSQSPSGRVLCPGMPQVALDVQHHQTMAALQQRVSSRERIVGWFSTGDPDTSRRCAAKGDSSAQPGAGARAVMHAALSAPSSAGLRSGDCAKPGNTQLCRVLTAEAAACSTAPALPRFELEAATQPCSFLPPPQPRRPHPLLLRPGVPQPGAPGAGHERAGRAHGRARLCVARAVGGRPRAGARVPGGEGDPPLARPGLPGSRQLAAGGSLCRVVSSWRFLVWR